jgi:DNA segregation ATPase FtsK/SpoIIIE, S-DNA-T family
MSVTLQVRDVREQIYRAAGGRAGAVEGRPSTALLGRLFHEVFADLVSGDTRLNFRAALDDAGASREEWQSALVAHAYRRLVGPRLREHQAHLHHVSIQVLDFWQAVQSLCAWLADGLWRAREYGYSLEEVGRMLRAEQPLSWTVREPGWSDEVHLVGVADAVWQTPVTERWCLLELKTGQTAPEADLAQACLYHQMLAASGVDRWGTLALVSFTPERREELYSAEKLKAVRADLITLIGRMAGVLPEQHETGGENTVSGSSAPPAEVRSAEHLALRERLIEAFVEYGVRVELSEWPVVGPVFLRFFVTPGARVTPAKVRNLAEPLQVRLGLDAPPRVGIEGGRLVLDLQRRDRETVYFSSIRDQLPAPADAADAALVGSARVPVGVDLGGALRLADFAEPDNAHLLVAGTPGSGKSEWLRSAIAGLLLTNTPDTLRLLLIDPKRNAFQMLADSPFLRRPLVFPGEHDAVEVFADLVAEMERRYQLMAATKSDTLADHVRRAGQPTPRIFCVCDEYADLVLGDRQQRREIETLIARLGQKARAAGIHLILATQQPSREIIKGTLDATIPARVGLKMQKAIESKMLLNEAGAEHLLGRGDLLFKCIGDAVRLQSPYLTKEEQAAVFGRMVRGEGV